MVKYIKLLTKSKYDLYLSIQRVIDGGNMTSKGISEWALEGELKL